MRIDGHRTLVTYGSDAKGTEVTAEIQHFDDDAALLAFINAEIDAHRAEKRAENVREAVGASVAEQMADTLRPTEYLLDHGVRLKSGRGNFWLYRYESADDFAFGEDRRKALAFTKAAAECTASILGKDWEAGRL